MRVDQPRLSDSEWKQFKELKSAAYNGDVRKATAILDVNPKLVSIGTSTQYFTALHEAAGAGKLEVVKLLIERGADVNWATSEGCTPLHSVAASPHGDFIEVARVLIQHGADVHAQTSDGHTPLSGASGRGHSGVVQVLQNHGATT